MRIAIVSDIHGNRTAFEAVLADLREISPDLILHGGDLVDGGASPTWVLDQIRSLGWPGVAGNADELMWRPEALDEAAARAPAMKPWLGPIQEMAAATRAALGPDRLAWLRDLPRVHRTEIVALVHARLEDLWRAPAADAADDELKAVYGALGRPIAVYGHIHRPFVRSLKDFTVANSGSVGLPYDGDPRAAYLLIDGAAPTIRRVEYDVSRELKALAASGLPGAEWIARSLSTARSAAP